MSKVASSKLTHINRSGRKVIITQGLAKGYKVGGNPQEMKNNHDKTQKKNLSLLYLLDLIFSSCLSFFLSHIAVFCEAVRILLLAKGGAWWATHYHWFPPKNVSSDHLLPRKRENFFFFFFSIVFLYFSVVMGSDFGLSRAMWLTGIFYILCFISGSVDNCENTGLGGHY